MKILMVDAQTSLKNQLELSKSFCWLALRLRKLGHEVSYTAVSSRTKSVLFRSHADKLTAKGIEVFDSSKSLLIQKGDECSFVLQTSSSNNQIDLMIICGGFFVTNSEIKKSKILQEGGALKITYSSTKQRLDYLHKLKSLIDEFSPSEIWHIEIDPLEIDFSKILDAQVKRFGLYETDDKACLGLYENYLFRNYVSLASAKSNLFVFGYVASNQNRKYLSDFVQRQMNGDGFELFFRDKFAQEKDNLLSQSEYYDELKKAKFSFIAPSNDVESFSLIRLFECLAFDVVPIVWQKCETKEAKRQYEDLFGFIEDNGLVFDENKGKSLSEFIEELDYFELIEGLKNTKSVRRLIDGSFEDVLEERLQNARLA